MRTAAEMKDGEIVTINEIDTKHPSSRRILEIGFTPGQEIELINKSFFDDPLAFSVRGTLIAIRKNEAGCIKIS
jgi:ferrous iron transport protein A